MLNLSEYYLVCVATYTQNIIHYSQPTCRSTHELGYMYLGFWSNLKREFRGRKQIAAEVHLQGVCIYLSIVNSKITIFKIAKDAIHFCISMIPALHQRAWIYLRVFLRASELG